MAALKLHMILTKVDLHLKSEFVHPSGPLWRYTPLSKNTTW